MTNINTLINPKVAVWNKTYHPSKGSLLNSSNLYTALRQQELLKGKAKGTNGSIFAYTNNKAYPENYNCDGLFFIDIDNINDKEVDGKKVADIIFDNFEEIAGRFPNLLAICYSYSRNIHAFVYDERFKKDNIDVEEYEKQSKLYLAVFAQCIKNVCSIDLRNYEDVLDTHNASISQTLFLNYSEFKWNQYCFSNVNISKNDIEKLKAEYHFLFRTFIQNYDKCALDEVMRVKRDENEIFNTNVPRVIDKNVWFGKWNGNDLRRMIASNILVYCNGDDNEANRIINENFDDPSKTDIMKWVRSARKNYGSFYNKDLYLWLFVEKENKVILEQNQYLNDVITKEDLKDKFIYIISNTNTGKTEWAKEMIRNNDVIVLHPNKALRDGKKHGVEDYTYENDTKEVDKSKSVNATIDVFVNKYNVDDMKGKIVIIDEAHLLEDYVSIKGRRRVIMDTINMIQYADKIIFMSATPKSEMRLFKFKTMKFEKKQMQNIYVKCNLLDVEKVKKSNKAKNITKTNAIYNYMYDYVEKIIKEFQDSRKVIIYSDKAQDKWKKYGLKELIDSKKCGLYRSKDSTEDCLEQINKFNNLQYPVTLATRYLGVGVEIKSENQGHIVINLDEGFDINFIEQCIGRYRNAKDIYLHVFASKEPTGKDVRENDEEIEELKSYYVDLHDDENNPNKLNILKAMRLNAYDGFVENKKLREAVGLLLANNIINRRNYASFISVGMLLQRLPYNNKKITINTKKLGIVEQENLFKFFENKEEKLTTYLFSLSNADLRSLMQYTVEDILNRRLVPFNDRTAARKILKLIKPMVLNESIPFDKICDFFNRNLSTMRKEYDKAITYEKCQMEEYNINDFDDEKLKEEKKKLEENNTDVELLFNKDFLDNLRIKRPVLDFEKIFEDSYEDAFVSVMSDMGVELKNIFNFDSYEEFKKHKKGMKQKADRKKSGQIGGLKTGKNAKKCKIVTDKLEKRYGLKMGMEFDSGTDICKKINVNKDTVRRWKNSNYIQFL